MIQKSYTHEILLKISYFILTSYFFFSLTSVNFSLLHSKYLLLIGLLLALTGFLFYRKIDLYRLPVLIAISIVLILTFIYYKYCSYINFGYFDYILLYCLVFFISMGNIDVKQFIKIAFHSKLIFSILIFLLFIIHKLPNVIVYRDGSMRQSLGFSLPNTLGLVLMCLTIEFLYLYLGKTNWWIFLLLLIVNVYVYSITLSRASFMCSILIIFFSILQRYTYILERKDVKYSLLGAIGLIIVLNLYLPYAFNTNNKIYTLLDKLFSGRLTMGHYYIEHYGISFFGYPVPDLTLVANQTYWIFNYVIDSAPLRIIMQYGIFIFILLFSWILFKCWKFANNGLIFEVCIILVCIVYSSYERYSYNIFIFSAAMLLFLQTEQNKAYEENSFDELK